MQVEGKTAQTVATRAGDSLVLQFWYSPRPGENSASNAFQVLWNGTVVDTLAPNGAPNGTALKATNWNLASYVVKATGSDTLAFNAIGNHPTYGALVDAVSLADRGASSVSFVSPAVNLSFGKNASGAEIADGTTAAEAVDGNIDGNYGEGSIMLTGAQSPNDYWEVDLGAVDTVSSINLFKRTDCCVTRLNNFYVLVSQTSMDGQSLSALLANRAVTSQYVANTGYVGGNSPQEYVVGFAPTAGRFVRVQLAGTGELGLAEVQVMGWPEGAK
jgi:hypothetical protein